MLWQRKQSLETVCEPGGDPSFPGTGPCTADRGRPADLEAQPARAEVVEVVAVGPEATAASRSRRNSPQSGLGVTAVP